MAVEGGGKYEIARVIKTAATNLKIIPDAPPQKSNKTRESNEWCCWWGGWLDCFGLGCDL